MSAIYLYPTDNVLSAATLSLGTGATAVGYDLANLYDLDPAKPWVAAAATTFYLLMDFGGTTRAMKAFHFHHHNFTAGITLQVQGNATNSWGSPTVDSTVSVPAAAADGLCQDFYWLSPAQTTALRWWRIGTATTNGAPWRLGELTATPTVSRALPFDNYQPTLTMTDIRLGGVEHLTPAGGSLRYQATSRYTQISGEIKGTRTEVLAVRDWLRACGGRGQPTSFILESDDSNKESFYVVPTEDPFEIQHVVGQIWRATLTLKTLARGLD